MISMWGKDEAKAVAKPIVQGCSPAAWAMGTAMGPTAATVAPSLMMLVTRPVSRD